MLEWYFRHKAPFYVLTNDSELSRSLLEMFKFNWILKKSILFLFSSFFGFEKLVLISCRDNLIYHSIVVDSSALFAAEDNSITWVSARQI